MAAAIKKPVPNAVDDQLEAEESYAELVLFQVAECYVYKIPPRKSAASYRADEWDINKWAWEGALKVVSKGHECLIRLEDTKSGELYAQSAIKADQPLPVEAVIDSSRFFVLRIEDTLGNSGRHAFVGLGFRERPEAYDFQAALYDHVKYMNKKKEAAEMEQEYQSKPQVDYSLKEGETIHLDIKRSSRPKPGLSDSFFTQPSASPILITPPVSSVNPLRTTSIDKGLPILPPPPSGSIGAFARLRITSESDLRPSFGSGSGSGSFSGEDEVGVPNLQQGDNKSASDAADEAGSAKEEVAADDGDFGDFQAAQ